MAETVAIRVTEQGSAAVARGFATLDRQISSVGRSGERATAALKRGFGDLRSTFGGLGTQLGALGVALGGRAILQFDDKLGQIQADAGLTTQEALKLRDQILGLQSAFGVSKDEIAGAVQIFQDFGGMVKEGVVLLPFLSKTAKATGTSISDLATLTSTLMQTLHQSPEEAQQQIARLNAHAIAGQISLKQMAGVMPELAAAASNVGLSVDEISTSLQTVGQATGGNVDTAKTSLLAMMAQLQAQSGKLKKTLGVDVFQIDPRTGKESMRSLEIIMSEILTKTGGKLSGKKGLLSFFNLESKKAVDAFMSSFDSRTGKLGGTFATVKGAGATASTATIDAQYKARVGGIAAESEKVSRTLYKLDEAFQTTAKRVLGWASANPTAALSVGVGAILAKSFGPGIVRWLMGRGKGGGAGGLAGAAGVTPVYVVNFPGAGAGLPGGLTGPMPAATAAKRSLGSRLGSAAGYLGAAGMGFGAGWGLGTLLDQQFGLSTKISDAALAPDMAIARARAAQHGQGLVGANLRSQAAALVGLSRQGVTSYGAAGAQQALTAENVMATLQASAARQGGSAETWAAVLPVLQQMLAELKKPPVIIPPAGITAPHVEAGRGTSR